MTVAWVLIFYMIGTGAGSGGGPATAIFRDQESCEAAGEKLKLFGGRYQGHVCVPNYTPRF
jgi:hypothetical protein